VVIKSKKRIKSLVEHESIHTTPVLDEAAIWTILEAVNDPEVPVLSVVDLGIVRKVEVVAGRIEIIITPTYSGCPAMDAISMDIRLKFMENGIRNIHIQQQLSPAWTTDWMSENGRTKLKAFGIAPPNPKQQFCKDELFVEEAVPCPRCESYHTQLVSQFGSTACKSMYRCLECKEAFDHFKCH
jgi:ring-1,2-phenylacetyl-CoA epoxidase subunit PaaD